VRLQTIIDTLNVLSDLNAETAKEHLTAS
jgi:hypothetical protein